MVVLVWAIIQSEMVCKTTGDIVTSILLDVLLFQYGFIPVNDFLAIC